MTRNTRRLMLVGAPLGAVLGILAYVFFSPGSRIQYHLARLADPSPRLHQDAAKALVKIGRLTVPGLLGVLSAGEEDGQGERP